MTVLKTDQKILDKYLNGKTIKRALQTPSKHVRGYATDNEALFIATQTQKSKLISIVALVTLQKGWNSSMHMEGSYLVCLLYP